MTVTVWQNVAQKIQLAQLSDDEADGTVQEQIAHLATLWPYEGFTCVCENYTGAAPDADPALWRWDGSKIVAAVPVPESVSPRQVRLLLLQQGLIAMVETLIAQQDEATKITWQYAEIFRRDDPLLNNLASSSALNLSKEELDQFFIEASKI